MKTFKPLHLLLLLYLVVVLRAQSQACRFLDSMLLINKFESCPSSLSFTQSGTFYLRLDGAPKELGLNMCSSNDYNSSLSDMCGVSLTDREDFINESLINVTCPTYRKIASDGPLGICEEVLNRLGHCVSFVPLNATDVMSNDDAAIHRVYNASSLAKVVSRIQTTLAKHFQVLDRTLVGIYFKNRGQRCLCLDSYKKWLCSTSLSLYSSTSGSNTTSCSGSTLTDDATNETVLLSKPCLSVCQRVVQSCPYYLPSSFQTDVKNGDTKEVVYGGFPAFDCPRASTLNNLYKNGSCAMCTYAHPDCTHCLGYSKGSAPSIHSVSLRTAFLWTLCLIVYLLSVFL